MKNVFIPFRFLYQQLKQTLVNGSALEKTLFFGYCIFFFLLYLYSYTQVDLGLVITRIPWLYSIEKQFQYIGYFNRPLATWLYLFLLVLFSASYIWLLVLLKKNKIHAYVLWSIVGIGAIVLTFAYNAFSYDLFNYIFDARIFTYYHQNPYLHRALDFPHDPMLAFMHWIERVYPYGPIWLAITIPVSYVGLSYFLPTFYLFKLIATISYVGSVYSIYRITKKIAPENALFGTALFALNPLIIFEFLISGHNDIAMFFLALLAFSVALQKKYWWAILLLLLSIGVKFATAPLLLIFFLIWIFRKRLDVLGWQKLLFLSFCLMLLPLYIVTQRTNFQPWYMLYILAFIPFIQQRFVQYSVIFVSFISLLLYIPFFWFGDWNSFWYKDSVQIFFWLTLVAAVAGSVYAVILITQFFRLQFAKH